MWGKRKTAEVYSCVVYVDRVYFGGVHSLCLSSLQAFSLAPSCTLSIRYTSLQFQFLFSTYTFSLTHISLSYTLSSLHSLFSLSYSQPSFYTQTVLSLSLHSPSFLFLSFRLQPTTASGVAIAFRYRDDCRWKMWEALVSDSDGISMAFRVCRYW